MAYGFEAKNDSGKVIINDTIENLHFIGKATHASQYTGYTNFPTYSGGNDTLDGNTICYYTITCSGTPVPFIKPTDYSRWTALIKQSVNGTTWTFHVMCSGASTSNMPEVYCFVNADDIAIPSGETHGMIVFKADGSTKTFDSRRQPLAITGGANVLPPVDPTNSSGLPGTTNNAAWQASSLDHDFRSGNQYTAYNDSNINTSNTMYACPSTAQAVYSRVVNGYKSSSRFYNRQQEHWSTAWWWVMYRGAYRLRAGHFDAGWNVYQAGYWYDEHYDSGGWFGSGAGGYSQGNRPYSDATINRQNNAYIIADSSRYD